VIEVAEAPAAESVGDLTRHCPDVAVGATEPTPLDVPKLLATCSDARSRTRSLGISNDRSYCSSSCRKRYGDGLTLGRLDADSGGGPRSLSGNLTARLLELPGDIPVSETASGIFGYGAFRRRAEIVRARGPTRTRRQALLGESFDLVADPVDRSLSRRVDLFTEGANRVLEPPPTGRKNTIILGDSYRQSTLLGSLTRNTRQLRVGLLCGRQGSLCVLEDDILRVRLRCYLPRRVPRWIREPRRVVVRIQVPVQAWRLIDLSEIGVLGQESPQLRIEVAGLGAIEAGFGVVEVSGEGEAVGGVGQFFGESEVAPGILGNPKTPLPHDETPTHRFSRRRLRWGRRAP
jgi:hypothetical protein